MLKKYRCTIRNTFREGVATILFHAHNIHHADLIAQYEAWKAFPHGCFTIEIRRGWN